MALCPWTSRAGAGLAGQSGRLMGNECMCLFIGTGCDGFLHIWRLIVHSESHGLIGCIRVTSSQASREVSHFPLGYSLLSQLRMNFKK